MQISRGNLRVTVNGQCVRSCEGVGWHPSIKNWHVNPIRTGRTYTRRPRWKGDYVQVNSNGWYQCGRTHARVSRRWSSWRLYSRPICRGTLQPLLAELAPRTGMPAAAIVCLTSSMRSSPK